MDLLYYALAMLLTLILIICLDAILRARSTPDYAAVKPPRPKGQAASLADKENHG